jgi:hypothetical protein
MKRSLVCSLVVALLFSGCGSKSVDPVTAANRFFQEIGDGKVDQAYGSTAISFQTEQSRNAFGIAIAAMNLNAPKLHYTWKQTGSARDEVDLEGSVTNPDGKELPLVVKLINERGEWRVFKLKAPTENGDLFALATQYSVSKGVGFTPSARRPIPSKQELQRLVQDSLMDFNQAIQAGDFATFYKTIALTWQDRTTPKQLKGAFQSFIDSQVNLGNLRAASLVFDKSPEISPDGLLVLRGHYAATGAQRPYFFLQYTYEVPRWKLIGLNVEILQ